MAKKKPRAAPALHVILALGAAVLVALLVTGGIKRVADSGPRIGTLLLTVEHRGRATLELTAAKRAKPGILELLQTESGSIAISLPEQMQLREVRGASFSLFPTPPATKGIRKWILRQDVTLSFFVEPESPSSIRLKVEAKDPLVIKTKTVDVASGSVIQDSGLMRTGEIVMW